MPPVLIVILAVVETVPVRQMIGGNLDLFFIFADADRMDVTAALRDPSLDAGCKLNVHDLQFRGHTKTIQYLAWGNVFFGLCVGGGGGGSQMINTGRGDLLDVGPGHDHSRVHGGEHRHHQHSGEATTSSPSAFWGSMSLHFGPSWAEISFVLCSVRTRQTVS
jgi:hypothetical protein